MMFPNAFKGVKKIWLAELLMLLAVVVGIVLLIVVASNSTMVDGAVGINKEAVRTPGAILGVGAALIALLAAIGNIVMELMRR